jgi:hypothetical protein
MGYRWDIAQPALPPELIMSETAANPAPEQQDPEQKDPVVLLVHAVNQLPEQERDQVLAWLLGSGWRQRVGTTPPSAVVWGDREERAVQLQLLQAAKPGAGERRAASVYQQAVPVRFSAEQHAQLREWCAEHGFSMATVIRGLVARFLEGQLPERN